MKKIIVLDTSAFIGGFQPQISKEECYTVQEVVEEIKDREAKLIVDLCLEEGRIKIVKPSKASITEVKALSKETGDSALLSEADIKIISLALYLKKEGYNPVIMTDDYDIQNLVTTLGIGFVPIVEGKIKKVLRWKNICKGCGKIFPIECREEKCDVCGSMLKKIAVKKENYIYTKSGKTVSGG